MKKDISITALLTMVLMTVASSFSYAGTNMTVRFNDCSTASYTTPTTINGVSLNGYSYGQNSYPVDIKSKSATIDGVSFTKAVYFKGVPNNNYITISFEVDGPCTIKTYGATSNSNQDRAHAIYKEGIAASNILATSNISTSNETITYNYTGEATTIYIASTNGGYYIYGIDVTYGENSGSGSNEQTQTLYTVTFNANSNGTCSTSSLTEASEGAGVTLPTVTANSGYNFLGWSTSSTATTASYTAGATYNPSANITLYAVYESTNTYPTAGSAMTFDATKRYSEWVINSRLNDFYGNTTKTGFGLYDDEGNQTEVANNSKSVLDYVPGLVAKAILEAVDYYKDNDAVNVNPWYYAIQNYGNTFDISSNGKNGKSFDDLNAVKLYFKLQELANSGKFADSPSYTNEQTVTTSNTRLAAALAGIKSANTTYFIKETTLPEAAGGWFHKSNYTNQMWCDGQYMGPALLAQMINDYANYSADGAITANDWDLVTKQFTISWNYLWNPEVKLLYHAFTADPGCEDDNAASTWAGISAETGNEIYHSAEYWGRAEGWYFLALVDVLEQMQIAGLARTENYKTLHGYLNLLAAGIAAKQDATTGCWYQLLNHDGTFYADTYNNGKSHTATYNYLESSATAIFTAAYLKGMRLGLYDTDYTTVAKKAYQGIIENFMVADGTGGIHLVKCCKSAGLGTTAAGKEKYRDGSAAYYLLGYDVPPTSADPNSSDFYTEGKVFGGFILAATEYERRFIDKKLELSENGSYTEFPQGDYDEVTLTRSFPTEEWTTMTIPFSVTAEQVKEVFGSDTEIASVSKITDSKLYFTRKNTITANEPVLIKVGTVSETGSYTFSNVTVENTTDAVQAGDGVQLKGTYTLLTGGQTGDLGADEYFIYDNKFYDCTYMSRMKPFRAYITADSANGAKQLDWSFVEDEEATAVNAVVAANSAAAGAVAYTTAGQPAGTTARGIVVQRNRKVLR